MSEILKEYYSEIYHCIMKVSSGILIFLNKSDKVIDCNERTTCYYGCSRNDILNKNFYEFLQSRDFPDPLSIRSKDTDYLKNQKVIFEWSSHPVNADIRLLIGKEKTYPKELIEQSVKDKYLSHFIQTIPGAIFWKSKEGIYLGCNQDFLKLSGIKSIDEVIGKTDDDMPWRDSAEQLREADYRVMETQIPLILEESGNKGGGSYAYVLSSKVPLRDEDNNIIGTLSTSVEITQQKELEAQLNAAKAKAEVANQAKSEFIASMSHDFRTPLNGVLSMAEVLLMKKHYPEQEEFIRGIYDSGKMLLYLVDDVLNFSQLEAGKFEFRADPCNLLTLVEEVVSMVSHQAQLKNLEIIVSYCDSVPHLVITDIQAVRRIMANLMGNAVKFTRQGYILISVDTDRIDGDVAQLQLSVEDTGIGISSEKIEHVFDRFYRAHSSYSSPNYYHGTGLGLTIVKQLVEGLGGRLGVNSQANQGSTFWCTLPFKLQSVPITGSAWSCDYAHVRILVVDDHYIRAEAIQMQLVLESTQVTSGSGAMNALEQAYKEGKPYQIVIVDDNLLEISALELAKNIKADSRFYNTLLILFAEQPLHQEAENLRATDFFKYAVKPVPPTELIKILLSSWQEWSDKITEPLFQLKLTKPYILLVEDNRIVQVATKAILEELGCYVEVAENSAQAIKKALNKPHIIFMDIGLSGDDGLTTTKLIRQQEASGEHIIIIALTAHVTDLDQQYCERAGMDGFLKKPASVEDFQIMLLKFAPDHSLGGKIG